MGASEIIERSIRGCKQASPATILQPAIWLLLSNLLQRAQGELTSRLGRGDGGTGARDLCLGFAHSFILHKKQPQTLRGIISPLHPRRTSSGRQASKKVISATMTILSRTNRGRRNREGQKTNRSAQKKNRGNCGRVRRRIAPHKKMRDHGMHKHHRQSAASNKSQIHGTR